VVVAGEGWVHEEVGRGGEEVSGDVVVKTHVDY